MQIIAERVFRPIKKTIILGILLSILISMLFLCVHIIATILIFLIACVFLGIRVYFIVRANNDDLPPIYVEGENIYCYNGKFVLEFSVWELYYAKGKHRKYFHVFGSFITWGTYNYGKVKIYYYDNGEKRKKFVIKNVLEPENVALNLMRYVEKFDKISSFTDYYQILRVRTDASQQEIFDAYNKLKNQKTDNIELITTAYNVLSSSKEKAEYDMKYWSVHND